DGPAPAWLRRVVMRGLSVAPELRYPSMKALVSALDRDPRVTRGRWALAAVVLAAASAAVAVVARSRDASVLCDGAEARLEGVWDDDQKRAVHRAFAATGKPYADDAFHGVERAFDAYAHAWAAMHGEACRATRVRREQSEELFDLRMDCLSRRLNEVRAHVD